VLPFLISGTILILTIQKSNVELNFPKNDRMGVMGMKAAGEYLHILREHYPLTLAAAGKRLNTSASLIFRIERGNGETRGTLLVGFIRLVNASPDEVINLLLDPNATAEEGERMARLRIEYLKGAAPPPPVVHPDILHLIEQMTPYDLGKWVAIGQRMAQDRNS
jgi:hypothetical protein